jgi:hypothetical protein
MIRGHKKILVAATLALLVTGVATSVLAEETEKPTADLSVALLSKYVWRGYELSKDSLVIQPSLTASYKGFGFNLWGNLDTEQDTDLFGEDGVNWNETDMTVSYDNSYGMVNYSLGYIYYALDSADDTQEIYAGIGLDTILAPTLTVYRDFAKYPGWYATLAVSHSFQLTETMALGAGGHVSYLSADDETTLADPDDPTSSYSDFHDGQIYLTLSIPVADYFTVSPELYYSFPLSSAASDIIEAGSANGDDSFIYGGISLSMSF